MAIRILISPGCRQVSESLIERTRRPGEVVIDAGQIYEALTGSTEVPSTNVPALKLALGLRSTAIRFARESNVDAIVRTGNADRAAINRLREQAGPSVPVLVHNLDRESACARVRQIVKSEDRRVACETGLGRFYDRLVLEPSDELIK